jgi:hypothetical protein
MQNLAPVLLLCIECGEVNDLLDIAVGKCFACKAVIDLRDYASA